MTVIVEYPDTSLPAGICQPGSVRLQEYLMNLFNLGNSGCYNPNSRLTDGTISFHVTGEAIDLTCDYNDPAQRARGDACFNWLYDHRDELNLQQIIFGHRIWSSFHQVISTYAETDHLNHLHCSLGRWASLNWQPSLIPPDPPPLPHGYVYNYDTEDEMKQARSIAYPVPSQINTFAVAKDGILRQVWYGAAGAEHKVDISKQLPGVGLFDVDSPPTFAVTANGDLLVFVYGEDGTPNALRYSLAAGQWGILTIGGW